MDLLRLFDFPLKGFIAVVAIGVTLMFLLDYGLPAAQPEMFFAGLSGDQPSFIMMDGLPYMNSTAIGELSALAMVFSWLAFREKLSAVLHKHKSESAVSPGATNP